MATFISPQAHVDPSAKIGENVTIHAMSYIDRDVEIGDDCEIMPFASVIRGTRMGRNNKVYQGACVGADPQDFRWQGSDTYCYIGDNNIIRENVIINRGIHAEGGTRIGNNVAIMANSHIAHDSEIEGKSVIGNAVSIAGNVHVGECVILSSGVIVHPKCDIGNWTLVKGGCRIASNVPPFSIMAHNPVEFFGVNADIMQRHGYSRDDIDMAAKCYRHIYQTGTSVFNALKRIRADVEEGPVREEIINFIVRVNNRLVAIPKELLG